MWAVILSPTYISDCILNKLAELPEPIEIDDIAVSFKVPALPPEFETENVEDKDVVLEDNPVTWKDVVAVWFVVPSQDSFQPFKSILNVWSFIFIYPVNTCPVPRWEELLERRKVTIQSMFTVEEVLDDDWNWTLYITYGEPTVDCLLDNTVV